MDSLQDRIGVAAAGIFSLVWGIIGTGLYWHESMLGWIAGIGFITGGILLLLKAIRGRD